MVGRAMRNLRGILERAIPRLAMASILFAAFASPALAGGGAEAAALAVVEVTAAPAPTRTARFGFDRFKGAPFSASHADQVARASGSEVPAWWQSMQHTEGVVAVDSRFLPWLADLRIEDVSLLHYDTPLRIRDSDVTMRWRAPGSGRAHVVSCELVF